VGLARRLGEGARVRVEALDLDALLVAAEREEEVAGAAADVQHALARLQLRHADHLLVHGAEAGEPVQDVVERGERGPAHARHEMPMRGSFGHAISLPGS